MRLAESWSNTKANLEQFICLDLGDAIEIIRRHVAQLQRRGGSSGCADRMMEFQFGGSSTEYERIWRNQSRQSGRASCPTLVPRLGPSYAPPQTSRSFAFVPAN
jgi:hypothetical protein